MWLVTAALLKNMIALTTIRPGMGVLCPILTGAADIFGTNRMGQKTAIANLFL
jgi:hypothetical protein